MEMTGEFRIPASREAVWQALNDPEILKQCIPGCEEIEKTSDTEFAAKVTAKVGPVRAKFSGAVTLSDIDPPNGYRISGEGTGGPAGFAKGGAQVTLMEDGADTLLSYAVDATVGGKLAQIGSRLIDSTSKKMANDFFGNFAELVGGPTEAAEPEIQAEPVAAATPAPSETLSEAPAEKQKGLSPIIWVGAVIVIVIIATLAFQQ